MSHTEKRMDKSICNLAWLDYCNSSVCNTLVRSQSDHFPLLLSANKVVRYFPSSFKFHRIWIGHTDCDRLIKEVCNRPVFGCPMSVLSMKLKNLKIELRSWNNLVFGNVRLRVQNALSAVNDIQKQITSLGSNDNLMEQEALAQVELQQALLYEEEFWRKTIELNGIVKVIGT